MIRKSFQIALLFVLGPCSAGAQTTQPQGPIPFGTGEQPQLSYAGESSQNLLSASFNGETAYDDNVLDTTKARGDVTFSLGPRIALVEKRKRLTVGLDYEPYFLLYRRFSQFDVLNHNVVFDVSSLVTRHLALRLRDSFRYDSTPTGIFEPRSSQQFVPGLGPPTSLNDAVLTPLAHTQENNARLDAIYLKSPRTSFDVFGGYLDLKYPHRQTQSETLFGARGAQGGLAYSYRVTPTGTLGVVYTLENMSFSAQSRMVLHGGLLSYAWQLSPTVTLSGFVGPQFSRVHDTLTYEIPFLIFIIKFSKPVVQEQWHAAFGGSLLKQSRTTVFEITGSRMVTTGGGYLREAVNSSVNLNASRRLMGRWNVIGNAEYADTSALGLGLYRSNIRYEAEGLGLERHMTERLTGRLAYNHLHQSRGGQIPLLANVARNRVSLSLFYQLRTIPLGR